MYIMKGLGDSKGQDLNEIIGRKSENQSVNTAGKSMLLNSARQYTLIGGL